MHLQDRLTTLNIGAVQHHLSVKAAGAKQRRVEDIGTICRCHNDDIGGGIEAIHLHQDLVEGLLPFVMATAEPRSPVTPHSVDLVDKDDTGAITLRLVEEVPHPGGTHADKHLHELAAAYGEEGDASLTGHRTTKQGLPRARRSHQ
ncbi:hypothetical protein ES707_06654 [subsurface metagenome]